MKILINIQTKRKLGGKNCNQIIIDEDKALNTVAKLVHIGKLKNTGQVNTFDDLSGRNYSGFIATSMLVQDGGEVINREIV